MERKNASITDSHRTKLVQMIPRGMTVQKIHSIFSSGLIADVMHAPEESVLKFRESSLWRDRMHELLGLPPVSVSLSFTTSKANFIAFAKLIRPLQFDSPRLRGMLQDVVRHPDDYGMIGSFYIARQNLTCVSFAGGVKVRDAVQLIRDFGYHIASIREYIKLLTFLNTRRADAKLPGDMFEYRILGGFEEDDRLAPVPPGKGAIDFVTARRLINPDGRGRLVTVSEERFATFPAKTWIVVEKDHVFESSGGLSCCSSGFSSDDDD